MAKGRKKKRKNKKRASSPIWFIVNLLLVTALLLCVFSMTDTGKELLSKIGIESGNFSIDSVADKDKEQDGNDEETSKKAPADTSGLVRFDFLEVGQADSTLVTTEKGSTILIDTATEEDCGEVVDFLKDRGVRVIDYLVLTHPHSDHIGGAEAVLDGFEVKNVLMPEVVNSGSIFDRTVSAIRREKKDGCKVYKAEMGDVYKLDGCEMKILGPASTNTDNLNNTSIVMTLKYRDFTALFTGDAEQDAENSVLGYGFDVDCALYKAGHHGSSTSSCTELLDEATPKLSVISCGDRNSYGHPHAAVTKALKDRSIKYYITADSGNVTVTTDGRDYSVFTER